MINSNKLQTRSSDTNETKIIKNESITMYIHNKMHKSILEEKYRNDFNKFMNENKLKLDEFGTREPSDPKKISQAIASFREASKFVGHDAERQRNALMQAAEKYGVKPFEMEDAMGEKIGAKAPLMHGQGVSQVSVSEEDEWNDLDECAGVGINSEHNSYPYSDIKKGTLKKTGAQMGFDITDDGIPPRISKNSINK